MIDDRDRLVAQNAPVTAAFYGQVVEVDADYVAEMVRQEMVERFGNAAYNDGYVVYTTVESKLQQAAHDALLKGLRTYDWRHGWRGPESLPCTPRGRHPRTNTRTMAGGVAGHARDCRSAGYRDHHRRRGGDRADSVGRQYPSGVGGRFEQGAPLQIG